MSDNYSAKDANGNIFTVKSKDTTGNNGPQVPQSVPSDATGNPFIDSNPLSVSTQPRQANYIDRSAGTSGNAVSIGTTSAQILPANPQRKFFTIQNLDQNNLIWINFGAAAVAGPTSIVVLPYGVYESPPHAMPTAAIYALSSAGTVLFTAKESN